MSRSRDLLVSLLDSYAKEYKVNGKGALSLLLVLPGKVRGREFPLKSDDFLTEGGGQVAGASGRAANKVLKKHGIDARLSEEGGRTNRGSPKLMKAFIDCLNLAHERSVLDLEEVEKYWVAKTQMFLSEKPFHPRLDKGLSIGNLFNDLFLQAKKRQATRPGSTVVGTLMQYMVAAKLKCLLNERAPTPHAASAADSSRSTSGDFEVEDSVIHVTTAPNESLMNKCSDNLAKGKSPIIVTTTDSLSHARSLAETNGIKTRVEFWAFEQFMSTNVHEWGNFSVNNTREQAKALIDAYNQIISELNEEPSLKIEI